MKAINLVKVTFCALLVSATVEAQTIYDATKFSTNDLNGTARFVGMGGAMGALGADVSTIGVNPAGIGLYRSNDLMTSFGFNYNDSKSTFGNSIMKSNKFSGSFDNIGFVYSTKVSNESALRYVNFGFNYRKVKDFNKTFSMSGDYGRGISQTNLMGQLCNREGNPDFYSEYLNPLDLMHKEAFYNHDVPWLGAMAYEAFLISPYDVLDANNNRIPQMDNGNVVKDKDGNICYLKKYAGYLGFENPSVSGNYYSKESGGIHSFDFNSAINLNDQVYLGATLGLYDIDYLRTTEYSESFAATSATGHKGSYTLTNRLKTEGAGVDFKLGVIIRPVENSPLRFGAAVHTPIFYKITQYANTQLAYNTWDAEHASYAHGTATPVDADQRYMEGMTDYQLQTPWVYNLSAGYTVGKMLALGAEYEYKDYSTSRLKYNDGANMELENDMAKKMLKGTNTFRLGAELKVVPEFAIRTGYNYSSTAFNKDAFLLIPQNSVITNTEYLNNKSVSNYTLGLGYKGSSFYADIAYQYSAYNQDFYAFEEAKLAATKIENSRQQVVMTVGVRF